MIGKRKTSRPDINKAELEALQDLMNDEILFSKKHISVCVTKNTIKRYK